MAQFAQWISRIPETQILLNKRILLAVERTILEVTTGAKRIAVGRGWKHLPSTITPVFPKTAKPEGGVQVRAFYGKFLEFGTGRRGAASLHPKLPSDYGHGPKPGMSAQPFLTVAAKLAEPKHRARMLLAAKGKK